MSKKDFTDIIGANSTPINAYISKPEAVENNTTAEDILKARDERTLIGKRVIRKKETKDKKILMLLTQSLYDDLSTIARFDNKSLNALLNEVMKEYAHHRQADIEAFNNIRKG